MAVILIADDDALIRDLVTYRLARDGHEVVAAEDGVAAMEVLAERRPDLVILDVMMPGMSGLDTVRALRERPELADLPVIMLTARAQESDLEHGFAAGVDDYLAKPFSPRELSLRVAAQLARRR